MSDYLVTDTELISVADAIRAKGETVATLEWPTGYSQAIAAIQTGLDIPQFEVTWDDEGSAVESITCDKTFLECNEYLDAGNPTITVYEHDVSHTYDFRMAGSLRRTNVSFVTYTVVTTGSAPAYDLRYNSDGTIDIIEPSSEMGTAGTPTATKGTVSNHAISVTPSVTNTTGYIYGETKTGTAVTVSASELVSGSYTVDSSGTKDVTNYASASVPEGSATVSATKGTVSNHAVSVTPSVVHTAGWVTGGSVNGTAVTVSASDLVSGSTTKSVNGTYDVTNYARVVVNVSANTGTGDAVKPTSETTLVFSSINNSPSIYYLFMSTNTTIANTDTTTRILTAASQRVGNENGYGNWLAYVYRNSSGGAYLGHYSSYTLTTSYDSGTKKFTITVRNPSSYGKFNTSSYYSMFYIY